MAARTFSVAVIDGKTVKITREAEGEKVICLTFSTSDVPVGEDVFFDRAVRSLFREKRCHAHYVGNECVFVVGASCPSDEGAGCPMHPAIPVK